MDYQPKYRLQAETVKYKNLIRVDIEEPNYTGTPALKSIGAERLTLEKADQDRIQGTNLKISIQADVNFEYFDFFNYDTRRHRVKLYENDVNVWTGFLINDSYSEPFRWPPYDVIITATDQLGILKNITYSTAYNFMPRIWVIAECLRQTGLFLDIAIAYDLQVLTPQGPKDFFWFLYFDITQLEGKNCYEVLELMLPPEVTITQHRGQWLIRRSESDIDKTHVIFKYYEVAVIEAGTQPGENQITMAPLGQGDIFPLDMASLSMLPAWKEVKIIQNLGLKRSFLQNADFQQDFTAWQTTAEHLLNFRVYGDVKYLVIRGRSATLGAKIWQSVEVQQTGADLALEISFTPVGSFGYLSNNPVPIDLEATFQVRIEGAATYYLDKINGWTTTPAYITERTQSAVTYGPEMPWKTLKIFAASIPASGILTVEIYQIINNDPRTTISISGLAIQHVNIYSFEAENYADPLEDIHPIRENSSISGDDITLQPADIPDIANARLIFKNGQFFHNVAAVEPARQYTDSGGDPLGYAAAVLAYIRRHHSQTRQVIEGTFRGPALHLNALVKIPICQNRQYFVKSGAWNILADTYDLRLIEIPGTATDSRWILKDGIWDDSGIWIDAETWNDTDPDPND